MSVKSFLEKFKGVNLNQYENDKLGTILAACTFSPPEFKNGRDAAIFGKLMIQSFEKGVGIGMGLPEIETSVVINWAFNDVTIRSLKKSAPMDELERKGDVKELYTLWRTHRDEFREKFGRPLTTANFVGIL